MTPELPALPARKPWGRVVLFGGTEWATLGRKDKAGQVRHTSADQAFEEVQKVINEERPDLETPHVLRSLVNVPIASLHTSHSGCHAVFLDIKGVPWLMGRNEYGQLGTGSTAVLNEPEALTSTSAFPKVPAALRESRIVYAACGRSHTLLVTEAGHIYAAGSNLYGICGDEATRGGTLLTFKRVTGALEHEKVVQAACGVSFSLALTESGRVFAWGSAEKGVLGNGKTGEHIMGGKVLFTEQAQPQQIRTLEGKKIVDIAAGQQHALARDVNGYVYSWGFGGLGRLGHGQQKDCLIPMPIHQFTHDREVMRAKKIVCGPTCSVVIDGNGMQYLFGKFKVSGDGSSGQPWMSPKPVHEIQAYKIRLAAAGSSSIHFIANGDTPKELVPIGFGQNALYGELGLGTGQPKSATKPQRVETMDGLDIIDVAAGQNTTFLLVRPPPVASDPDLSTSITNEGLWEDLPRFPPILDVSETCVLCNEEKGDDEALLECEKCEELSHLECLNPPLSAVPEGEFFCSNCTAEIEARASDAAIKKPSGKSTKRKAEPASSKKNGVKRKR